MSDSYPISKQKYLKFDPLYNLKRVRFTVIWEKK